MKESFFANMPIRKDAPKSIDNKPHIYKTPHTERIGILENQKIIPRDTEGPDNPDRRKFLKGLALTVAGTAATFATKPNYEALATAVEKISDMLKPEDTYQPTLEQLEIVQSDEDAINSALNKIKINKIKNNLIKSGTRESVTEEAEAKSKVSPERKTLAEELLLRNEKTFFDTELTSNLEAGWLKNYSKGEIYHLGLTTARKEMQPWIMEILECFRKAGVPEKFAYLAIPESHFDLNATSTSAKGPYQFTYDTADAYSLRMNKIVDERLDPVKSAEACAKNLRYLYDNCGDWNIALSGYNGRFIWKYFANSKKSERTYPHFLAFISDTVNKKREEIKDAHFYTHSVESDHYKVKNLLKDFDISIGELKRHNHISSDELTRGQKIKIPIKDSHHRSLIFKEAANVDGLSENLNYPAKFNAVWKVMEENGLDTISNERPVSRKKIRIDKELIYTVRPNENLSRICSRLSILGRKLTPEELMKCNRLKNSQLQIKQKLRIPNKSLLEIASGSTHKLAALMKINPAIKEPHSPLPSGFEVRVV